MSELPPLFSYEWFYPDIWNGRIVTPFIIKIFTLLFAISCQIKRLTFYCQTLNYATHCNDISNWRVFSVCSKPLITCSVGQLTWTISRVILIQLVQTQIFKANQIIAFKEKMKSLQIKEWYEKKTSRNYLLSYWWCMLFRLTFFVLYLSHFVQSCW